jgi:peptide/nickel transport system ATP-binding protein
MYRGRIVENGARDAVLAPPHHPYTEALLSAVSTITRVDRDRIRLPLEALRSSEATGCVFAGRCPRRLGPICDTVEPPLRVAGSGHSLSCHLPLATA